MPGCPTAKMAVLRMSAPIPAKAMGTALSRVDGRLKVTGTATYSAEFNPPNVAYAFAVMSPISKGTISAIDSALAETAPGVLAVLTHLNVPKLAEPRNAERSEGIRIEQREPLADNKIFYGGQYIAAIVADTPEDARYAASLLKISYAPETPALQKENAIKESKPKEHLDEELQKQKGDVTRVFEKAGVIKIEPVIGQQRHRQHLRPARLERRGRLELGRRVGVETDDGAVGKVGVIQRPTQSHVRPGPVSLADAV